MLNEFFGEFDVLQILSKYYVGLSLEFGYYSGYLVVQIVVIFIEGQVLLEGIGFVVLGEEDGFDGYDQRICDWYVGGFIDL